MVMKREWIIIASLVLFSMTVNAEEFIDPFPEEGMEEKWIEEEWMEEVEEEVIEEPSDQSEPKEDEEMVATPVESPPIPLPVEEPQPITPPEIISPPLPSFVIDEPVPVVDEMVPVEDVSKPSVEPIELPHEEEPIVESSPEDEELLPTEIPPIDLSELDCDSAATYSNETRQAVLSTVEIPLYTDIDGKPLEIDGKPVMLTGLYSAVLEIPFGFFDFEVKEFSFQKFVTESDPCHAKFTPATGILEVPEIEVPTLPILSYGQLTASPVIKCRAVLQQSVLREEALSLKDFECY